MVHLEVFLQISTDASCWRKQNDKIGHHKFQTPVGKFDFALFEFEFESAADNIQYHTAA